MKPLVSIVVPAYNEGENIRTLARAIADIFATQNEYLWELIFVDDGSADDTLEQIQALSNDRSNVYYIEFSRNFGHQSAVLAGYALAKGDCVITMDCDMQHPPELLPEMIRIWAEGYEVVYTRREQDKKLPFVKRLTSNMFYRVMNSISNVKLDHGVADFRLLDRRVINVLNSLGESDPFVRGLVKWVGFKQYALDYKPGQRVAGESKYTFKKMANLGIRGVTSFSTKPLHLAIWVGMTMAALSLLYLPYVVWSIYHGHTMAGWSSMILTVVFLGGLQLMILGIIGIYLGKLFMQSKQRPEYIIRNSNIK